MLNASNVPWLYTVKSNVTVPPGTIGVPVPPFKVFVNAKSNTWPIVTLAGSWSSSSVPASSSPGMPLPSPPTTSSDAVSGLPPASLVSSPSGVLSISSAPKALSASLISAKFTNSVPWKFISIAKSTSTVVISPASKSPKSNVPSAFQSVSTKVIPVGT